MRDEYFLTTREVAARTGFKLAGLRDWRKRGFLDGFGTRIDNGWWLYSEADVRDLHIIIGLNAVGIEFPLAFRLRRAGVLLTVVACVNTALADDLASEAA